MNKIVCVAGMAGAGKSVLADYAEIENLEKGGPIAMADFKRRIGKFYGEVLRRGGRWENFHNLL